ncbi:Arc family DNA-binding protein [Rhodobacteraceae bacterium F11138]|nr:Arc family DNA-binding protein [Rhodobacteraceae bacterium F11138]
MADRPQLLLRLPRDLKVWLAAQSEENASSQNSEVIRAIRERMARNAEHETNP